MDSSPDEAMTPPAAREHQQEDEDEEDEVEEEDVLAGEEEEEEEEDDGNNTTSAVRSNSSQVIRSVPTLTSMCELRDLSQDAIWWELSSAKPGNGVEQVIQDSSTDTYWQSDGAQPHSLSVHFGRRVGVSHVCLYLDYNLDESYTPKTVLIKAGMTAQDLSSVTSALELQEPVGWCIVPLVAPADPLDTATNDHADQDPEDTTTSEGSSLRRPVKTHLIQISILAMHQNGRDTHVRRVKLYGPKRGYKTSSLLNEDNDVVVLPKPLTSFTTIGMTQFNTVR